MKVTFLGTGTSQGVPVISCDCRVCRSDHAQDKRLRVSVLLEMADKTVVIDSGPDFRYQMLRAGVKDLDAIVFTHEHKDHVAGLDDIRPFNYLKNKSIDIFAVDRVQAALRREFAYIFEDSGYFGLPKVNMITIDEQPFKIGETEFIPVEVMHHKLPVMGYRIGNFAYVTDAKTLSERSIEKLRGTELLVLNALQREDHISHLTLAEAIDMAGKIGARMTYLTHLSHNMGLHREIEQELPSNIRLAYDGLKIEV
ncbi:MAG: MBL fold metallo-hydrolase [Chitinophagaceae bacterium]|nr:MAG: MBL fold metallo-hydrolase [Chitinophagaceae bacterium]